MDMNDHESMKDLPDLPDVGELVHEINQSTADKPVETDWPDVPETAMSPADPDVDTAGSDDSAVWDREDIRRRPTPVVHKVLRNLFDLIEMISLITISIILCFSFLVRLNVVDGRSMEDTLHPGEYLVVSDLFYKPKAGDIAVIHDITAGGEYNEPLVKRIIATGGQKVDIDFSTWTLTVDDKVVDESAYITLKDALLSAEYSFPIIVEEGYIFVLGDNRNHSGDSRKIDIGQIDERCVVGKVYARILPFNKMRLFSNPYAE